MHSFIDSVFLQQHSSQHTFLILDICYQLEKDSLMLTEQAKKMIAMKQKERALLLLKLRRSRETEATKLDKELLSILEMISNVEWEYANMEVLKALKLGNAALNKLHQEMTVDDVVELLEQTNEAIEVENRINEVFASQFDTLIDNGELERELAELMGEYGKCSSIRVSICTLFLIQQLYSPPLFTHSRCIAGQCGDRQLHVPTSSQLSGRFASK